MKTVEQELREELSKVDPEKFIGLCITDALQSGKPGFENLISVLKDQLRDAPASLANVIGEKGIQLLKQL